MVVELRKAFDAARARWPQIQLSLEGYTAHVQSLMPSSVTDGIELGDLYLAAAAAAGDPGALAVFEAEILAGIGRHLTRFRQDAEFVDEVRQAVRIRLLVGEDGVPPRIARFSGQGALGAWVRVTAMRVALNLCRQQQDIRPIEEMLDLTAPGSTPELAVVIERSRAAVADAVRAAFSRLASEDRALLRLHLLDNLSIDALATLYQIHRSTAARRIASCRQAIVDETLAALGGSLQLAPAELESLLGLVRSRLELSLNDLLATLA